MSDKTDPRGPYRAVLRIRDARALIGASAASQLGDWLYNAALLGYIYSATKSATWVGAATVGRLLPYVLLGPLGGTLADRYPNRRVLLAGDALRLLLMVILAGVVAARGPVALVISLTALASSAGSAEKPAAMALLPRLVGEVRLGPANALLHTAQDLGIVVGPAIGAVLLAVAPAWVAFLANAATFGFSALLISSMRRDSSPVSAQTGVAGQLRAGLRTAGATPFARVLFLVVAMVEFTYGAQTVQLVVYAQRSLGLGAGGYGELLAAAGAGGLIAALIGGRLSTHRRTAVIIVATATLACGTQLVYPATGMRAFALAAAVVGGAGLVCCEVVAETACMRIAPGDALGRMMGIFDATSVAAMISGAILAPVLIAATSLRVSLVVVGSATVLLTLLSALGLRGLDALSAGRVEALAARISALEDLPVMVGVRRLYLEQLASAAQFCSLPAGVDVVVQGAPAHAFYAVIEGQVLVHRDNLPVVHLGSGDSFGERGLLDNAPRNATVTTEAETTLLRVEGSALLEALESAPSLRPALDLLSAAPGVRAPGAATELVDDQRWVRA